MDSALAPPTAALAEGEAPEDRELLHQLNNVDAGTIKPLS